MTTNLYYSKNEVSAGGTLKGTLYIVTDRKLHARQLKVFFCGKEYSKILVRKGMIRSHTYYEEHPLIRVNVATSHINSFIRRYNTTLPPGSYQVPFSIHLPSHLPPSMAFGDLNNNTKIEYFLQADLMGSGILHAYQVRKIVPIKANPRLVPTIIPHVIPPHSQRIQGGLFFDQGQIVVEATADNRLLAAGQQMKLDLLIANENPASIHSISVVLQEKAEWSAQQHRVDHGPTQHTSRVRNLIQKSWRTSSVWEKRDATLMKGTPQCALPQKRNPLMAKEVGLATRNESRLSLTLPPVPKTANSTSSGTCMSVSHELTVTLVTDRGWSNPELRIPVQIVGGQKPVFDAGARTARAA